MNGMLTEILASIIDTLMNPCYEKNSPKSGKSMGSKSGDQNSSSLVKNKISMEEKHWEETIIIFIQNYSKLFKKFLQLFENSFKGSSERLIKCVSNTLKNIKEIFVVLRIDILNENLKFLNEAIFFNKQIFLIFKEEINVIFENIYSCTQRILLDVKQLKGFIGKSIPKIFQFLLELWKSDYRHLDFKYSFNIAYQVN